MKNNIITKQTITTLFLLFSVLIYSQQVFITNVEYQGIQVSEGGSIDLGSGSSYDVSFDLRVTRNYFPGNNTGVNELYQNGVLKIILYKNSGESIESSINITGSSWTIENNNTYVLSFSPIISLHSIDFPITGGWLVAEYESNSGPKRSGYYDITKPKFTLSPTDESVACGSTGKTFTVSNNHNSPGILTYNWQVDNNWEYQGNVVSNFTTSTNSVTLVPTTFPPSNVKVTPVLDGVPYDELTSTINLSDFSIDSQGIIGASTVCSSRNYILNDLPSDTTITWSVSNTSIATVAPINSSEATVTATGNGVITLTALVTNSCNQTVELTKRNINIGSPSFASGSMTGESNPFTGDFEQYTVPVASGASNYDWYFDVGGVSGTSIDGWKIVLDQNTNFVNITVGNPGLAVLVCKATNSCGGTTKYKYITAHSKSGGGGGGTDPCLTSLKFSSNPMKSGVSTNKIIIIDDPCLNPTMKNVGVTTTNHSITIYNRYSSKVYSKTQKDKEFNINNLPKGFYIVKYKNTKGRTITKNLLIN
jgi:hypothetical protein